MQETGCIPPSSPADGKRLEDLPTSLESEHFPGFLECVLSWLPEDRLLKPAQAWFHPWLRAVS